MTKKMIGLAMAMALLFTLAACGQAAPSSAAPSVAAESTPQPAAATEAPASSAEAPAEGASTGADGKTLVVYFSVPDNRDNSYVEVNGERLGNTQYMAYIIQENTGADLFRILPTTPYPTDHDELLRVAQEEIRSKARPEIEGTIENFDSYGTVFVGYPNWNADLPYILYTFFESYDFSGKTIIPFNTHGGSGFSRTRETIAQLQPNAAVQEGLSISRNDIEGSEPNIVEWLDQIGMRKAAQ